ncbi:MAG: thioredoxin family protein [Bacteroidota bacterium]
MKRLLILSALLIAALSQTQALTIIEQDLSEAQNVAKAEGKLLLIDFYTTWCGPCRMFSAEVHDNEEFAEAISKDYVMLKYDAENDNHGLTAKYHVSAYPTFAILTADMKLVHKTMGYGDPSGFVEFMDEGKNKADAGEYIVGVSQQIEMDFPEIYTNMMTRRQQADEEAIAAYWTGVEDRTAEVPFALMTVGMYTDEVLEDYVENLDTYRELYGETDANGVIESVLMQDLFGAIRSSDAEAWEAAKNKTMELLGEEAGSEMLSWVEPRWFTAQGEWTKFADHVDGMIEEDPEDYSMINNVSWQVYEECDDQAVILRAIEWMRPVIENEPDFMTLDTYAWLFYKNEQYEEAERYIRMAIAAGQEEGTDVSESEAMLPLLEEVKKED